MAKLHMSLFLFVGIIMDDDLVTVYSPLAFRNDITQQNYVEEENILRKLASNTVCPTLKTEWNVWDAKSFKKLHKGITLCNWILETFLFHLRYAFGMAIQFF